MGACADGQTGTGAFPDENRLLTKAVGTSVKKIR